MILFQYIRKYYLIFRFKELIRGIVCIIIILYCGNKMATEFLIACILFTIQIIEILRAKILKQILLRLFCRERMGVSCSAVFHTDRSSRSVGVAFIEENRLRALLRCFL